MKLKKEPFEKIWEGSKTIELRLYDEKRRNVFVGDIIEFENLSNCSQRIIVGVTALHLFDSFEKLYEVLPLEKCGYENDELDKASASDMNIYYPLEEQKSFGVVGIEFELLDKIG
jgi:ASC-1-like (ASCH) protein